MKDDAFRKFLVLGIIILFVGASVVVPNVKIMTNVENIFSASAKEISDGTSNNPPVFGLPNPTNNSADQPLVFIWSIPISDPEGDNFNWSIECSNGQSNNSIGDANGTKSLSLSGLLHSTTYTVWVNATDPEGSGNYTREWFTFTTKASSTLVVTITKPAKGHFYFRDILQFPLIINTIVYGPIEITVNATSDAGIEKVEFFINGKYEGEDTTEPYSYKWNRIICSLYRIKVIAYDNDDNSDSDEITVLKWRAHPILILAGSLFILKQLKSKQPFRMTFIRGTVLNLKRVRNEYHARALRLHYTEFTGLHRVSSTIKLRRVSFSHGPFIRTYDIGPLGLTTYIIGFVPGGLN